MTFDLNQLRTGLPIPSTETMESLGEWLTTLLPDDAILTLSGTLGVGKTTLVRGIAKGLNIHQTVSSPTFNLYNIYKGSRQLIHMDAYRLNSGDDLDSIMFEDFMQSPWLWVVEWPEKVAEALPENTIDLAIWIDAHVHYAKLNAGLY